MSSGPKGFSLHSSLFRCGYLPSANPISNIQRSEARKSLSGREALIFVTYSSAQFILVPGGGVEPPRPCGRRILSPLRLPVPPSRHRVGIYRLRRQYRINANTASPRVDRVSAGPELFFQVTTMRQ